MVHLKDERAMADSSRKNHLAVLRSFFQTVSAQCSGPCHLPQGSLRIYCPALVSPLWYRSGAHCPQPRFLEGDARWEWDPEDLIDCWTLVDVDRSLVGNKTGPTRLGFALSLKFFELEARYPRHAGELPSAAVEYVASLVKVDPGKLAGYRFAGRKGAQPGHL